MKSARDHQPSRHSSFLAAVVVNIGRNLVVIGVGNHSRSLPCLGGHVQLLFHPLDDRTRGGSCVTLLFHRLGHTCSTRNNLQTNGGARSVGTLQQAKRGNPNAAQCGFVAPAKAGRGGNQVGRRGLGVAQQPFQVGLVPSRRTKRRMVFVVFCVVVVVAAITRLRRLGPLLLFVSKDLSKGVQSPRHLFVGPFQAAIGNAIGHAPLQRLDREDGTVIVVVIVIIVGVMVTSIGHVHQITARKQNEIKAGHVAPLIITILTLLLFHKFPGRKFRIGLQELQHQLTPTFGWRRQQ
mmetsp:Transcript_20070/g.43196  ORF Transcript_20070/g.43196 Transcript_20070/m.43196 type:complete len:293 (+) Transcript_20070:334-1212(+)